MSSLRDYQERTVGSLLQVDPQRCAEGHYGDEVTPPHVRIHQTTIFSALTKALCYSFPTVSKLLSDQEFERASIGYARRYPPRAACLNVYGSEFPEYLRDANGGALDAALLFDAARFDLAVREVANEPLGHFRAPVVIREGTVLRLDRSLRCEGYEHPVDTIRDAPALIACRQEGHPTRRLWRHLAIWRKHDGAGVKVLSNSSSRFLTSLLNGADAEHSIVYAVSGLDPDEVILKLQHEVLSAPFCAVTPSYRGQMG